MAGLARGAGSHAPPSVPANGTVTSVAGGMSSQGPVVFALQGGTVRSFQASVAAIPPSGQAPLHIYLPLLLVAFLALNSAGTVLLSRDSRAAAAGAATPPEEAQGR